MNYYQHHIGDYAAATAYLSLLEDAIYTRLIRIYYRDERPLPADTNKVAWLIGLRSKKEKVTLTLILSEFFTLYADGWHNARADEEIARYQEKQDKAKASADARWGKAPQPQPQMLEKANKNNTLCGRNADASTKECGRNADAMLTNNQEPIYKSKAQQQLSLARVNAAPTAPPMDDVPVEEISAQPDAEPANSNPPTAERPAASTANATAALHPADPALTAQDIDMAAAWNKWDTLTRIRVLLQAGANDKRAEESAVFEFEQFSPRTQQKLTDALLAILQASAQSDGPSASPGDPPTDPASVIAEPSPSPMHPETALKASLTPENVPDKGFIHAAPSNAIHEQKQTVSANPVVTDPTPTPGLANLRAMGVPESIDLAVWQNFESGLREKGRWSNAACFTLVRQLRRLVDDGVDGNALLEWATVRHLMDLPDAWQRMQDDDAARRAKQCVRNATALPTDATPVAESVPQSMTDHSAKPSENLEKPAKIKKETTERGCRLPDNWQPSDELMLWAQQKYPNVDVFSQIERFCDYWHGKPGKEARKTSWDATFRNWIRKADELESTGFKSAGRVAAGLIPNAGGRLPGESGVDAALRLYIEDLQKNNSTAGSVIMGLLNDTAAPALSALPLMNEEKPE